MHPTLRQRIALDMDDVMADTLTVWLERYNQDFGTRITKADLHGKKLYDLAGPDRGGRRPRLFGSPGVLPGPAPDGGESNGGQTPERNVRGLRHLSRHGPPQFFSGQIRLAQKAFSLHPGLKHRVLRR